MAMTRARPLVGWTLLIVGALMGAQWLFFLATGSVEELQTAPRAIAFHLAAETVTAVLLVAAGLGLLRGEGERLALIATGALLYTVINSAGYFADRGAWPMVAMFGVLLVVTLGCAALLALRRSEPGEASPHPGQAPSFQPLDPSVAALGPQRHAGGVGTGGVGAGGHAGRGAREDLDDRTVEEEV
jgi:hypothetical protein